MRSALGKLLAGLRRLRAALWIVRARARMRWSRIALHVELGPGVAFTTTPHVYVGGGGSRESPGRLRIRVGANTRIGPGVVIEVEPGGASELVIGSNVRIGPNVHFHLRCGRVAVGDNTAVRDGTVLKSSGDLDIGRNCTISYRVVMHCSDRIAIDDAVGIGEHSTVVDSGHQRVGDETTWTELPVPTEPVVIGRNAMVFANVVLLRGTEIGPDSNVAAASIVRGSFPAGALIAGNPAEVVRDLRPVR